MNRIDTLKRKAIQARPGSIPNFNRATTAYFNMVSHVYNDGRQSIDDPPQPVPEIDSPDFWALFDQLDLDCSREEMRAWIDFEPARDHIPLSDPRKEESYIKMMEYLAAKK